MRRTIFLWILLSAFGIITPGLGFADEAALYKAQNKRDPFVPLVAMTTRPVSSGLVGVESLEDVQIEGVVMDADSRQSVVVVNGTMMRSGDEIGSVKVLEIRPDGARFSVNGAEAFKPLYQNETGENT